MLAALLGGLVELARFEAAFAKSGERPQEALTRVKPLAAILLESTNDVARNDLFLTLARKKDVKVFVFGSRLGQARDWADERNVPVFELPDDVPRLQESLEKLRNGAGPASGGRKVRLASRRAHAERDQEGTLIFDDGMGTRWSVYDRRGPERRRADVERRFVSANGRVLHCSVTEEEAGSTSVSALAAQLARSTPLSE